MKAYTKFFATITLLLAFMCSAMSSALAYTPKEEITVELKTLLEKDPALKALVAKSIRQAATVNPDKKTNPVQSVDQLYAFVDHSVKALPMAVLDPKNYPDIFTRIDQSVDYFWFLFDQPLPELAGNGYYYPSLQYHPPLTDWIVKYCKTWGAYLSSPESWNEKIYQEALKEKRFNLQGGLYGDKNVWTSFNDFFARQIVDLKKSRPIADASVVAPADSKPQGIWKIDENGSIAEDPAIKSAIFTQVSQLIGKDSAYHDAFNGGTLTHTFLNVDDYHHYHVPVSGKVLEVRKIPALDAAGGVTVWDPKTKRYVLLDAKAGWQMIETRDCAIIETEEFGLVAVLPIGMSQISSCNWESTFKAGVTVQKGDPMGYFLFGGSDIVMVFQKGVDVNLIPKAKDDGTYPHLLMGEPYATLKKQ